MRIRDYRTSDARALTDLFHASVREVGVERYTEAEVRAWAPEPIDYMRWRERLDAMPPFLAEVDGEIVGFITLTDHGHVEWTYTHPGYQRRGIASALYEHMERVAVGRGLRKLTVNASRFARPFFAKHGFVVVRREEAERLGERLENWWMEKNLEIVGNVRSFGRSQSSR